VKSLVLLLALLIPGAAMADWTDNEGDFFIEVGIGMNIDPFGCSYCWEDNGSPEAHFKATYEKPMNSHTTMIVYYKHDSNWLTGFPFEPADESSHDSVGVSMKFKLDL
jgi:hypothetical protein